ncbi:MAG: hypothetical protein ACLVG5_02665 [Clostridium sp.]
MKLQWISPVFPVWQETTTKLRQRSAVDEVEAVVDIYSRTSAIAGWSIVAVLRNILSPVVF